MKKVLLAAMVLTLSLSAMTSCRDTKDKTEEAKETLNEAGEDLEEAAEDAADALKEAGKEAKEMGKKALDSIEKAGKETIVKSKVENTLKDLILFLEVKKSITSPYIIKFNLVIFF